MVARKRLQRIRPSKHYSYEIRPDIEYVTIDDPNSITGYSSELKNKGFKVLLFEKGKPTGRTIKKGFKSEAEAKDWIWKSK